MSADVVVARVEDELVGDTDRVEMVLRRVGTSRWRAAAADGWCEFEVDDEGGGRSNGFAFRRVAGGGRDPLGDTRTDAFLGLDAERSELHPDRTTNAYPNAHEQVAQFFDHPSAPDLLVVRTAAFHVHGNLGEHGSPGAVQSRAAFLAGGRGIRRDGIVDRHLRSVDVAPTIAAVLGCRAGADGRHLLGQDGRVDHDLLDGDTASHAVAFLLDGTNANVFVDALEAGSLPHLAEVLGRGTAYRRGLLAALPTVTLPNHLSLLTGAFPGTHGVLSNGWLDRPTGATPNLLDPAQMIRSCDHLLPGVETLHEAIHRDDPSAFTATTYEYADRGADWSTFAELRAGRPSVGVPRRDAPIPHGSADWYEALDGYRFMSRIDTASAHQARALFAADAEHPLPRFVWVNCSLTDEAGHHGGPHGDEVRAALADTDARIGTVLEAIADAGILDETAVFVLADHGMELTDPAVDGHYRPRLEAAGIAHHDIDDGLIYLGDRPAPLTWPRR